MSRFWAGVASSSSESGSSSDDSSSESSAASNKKKVWLDDSSDSSDDSQARVVISAKTRTFQSLEKSTTLVHRHIKLRDYTAILTHFEALIKTMSTTRTKSIIDAHGGVPRFFVKVLVVLEDFVKVRKADKAEFRKLSPSQGRSLNRLGLVVRKVGKTYVGVMKELRSGGDISSVEDDSDDDVRVADSDSDDSDSDSDEDSDDDSDSDSDSSSDDSSAPAVASSSDSDSESDDSDSDDWDASSDDGSSSGSGSGSGSDSGASASPYAGLKGRDKWLKKTVVEKVKRIRNVGKPKDLDNEEEKKEVDKAAPTKLKEEELTAAIVQKQMAEIVSARGRRTKGSTKTEGNSKRSILKKLEVLSGLATRFGPRVEVPVLMHVVTAQFDMVRTLDDVMEAKMWKACAGYLERIADVLGEEAGEGGQWRLGSAEGDDEDGLMIGNLMVKSGEGRMKEAAGVGDVGAMDAVAADRKLVNPHTGEAETEDERAERLRIEKEAAMTPDELRTIPVVGSLSLFLSRLTDEFTKSLQRLQSHSIDYVVRLRDEKSLISLLQKVQAYYIRVDAKPEAAELALLTIEHLYYRHDSIAHTPTDPPTPPPSSASTLQSLCTFVYQHGTDRSKTHAMMCHIYHHALHDRFLSARDLLLMSHLQDNIPTIGDVATMVLFNRMMVTVGLCAFRLGRIWDAHQCLTEVCSERPRELLAQGMTSGHHHHRPERTVEQEKAERRRQVPYHLHVNQDLLEAVHLVCAMLLEIPNVAAHGGMDGIGEGGIGGRRARVISRRFRKNHDQYNRQVFTGPPEQTKDYVMRAANELGRGEWRKCVELLVGLEVWDLVPGEGAVERIKEVLVKEIRLAGLRTYLFAYSAQYESLSLDVLCGMFDMERNEVHSVVSKMMINRELHASWDQPTETIVLRNVDPSPLQTLALQFAERTANLVESNERLLDSKTGNYGHRDSDGNWKTGDNHRGRGGHGGRGGHSGRGRHGGRGGHHNGEGKSYHNNGGGRGYHNGGRGRGRGRGSYGRGGRGDQNRNNNRSW